MQQDSTSYNNSNDSYTLQRDSVELEPTPEEVLVADPLVPALTNHRPVVVREEDSTSAENALPPPWVGSNTYYSPRADSVRRRPTVDELVIADSLAFAPKVRTVVLQKEDRSKMGDNLPFKIEQIDGVFLVLLLCFLFFVRNYNGGIGFVKEKIKQIFSSSVVWKPLGYSSENSTSLFLLFQFTILGSIVIYDVLMFLEPVEESLRTPFTTLLMMASSIGLYLLLKVCIYHFVGFVFSVSADMKSWIRTYLVMFETLGVVLFIPTLLLVYSDYWNEFFLSFVVILLVLAHLILFYKLIVFFISEKFNFLYLISYLCAVEVIPLVFLALGLVYLYRFDVLNLLWLLK